MKSSLEIAQDHRMQPIVEIAHAAGLKDDEIELYGRYKAKIELSAIDRLSDRPDAKIVNVTAITPTPAGEGKTTTSVVARRRASATSAASPCSASASRRSAPSSASRAAPPAAASPRSCRWRT